MEPDRRELTQVLNLVCVVTAFGTVVLGGMRLAGEPELLWPLLAGWCALATALHTLIGPRPSPKSVAFAFGVTPPVVLVFPSAGELSERWQVAALPCVVLAACSLLLFGVAIVRALFRWGSDDGAVSTRTRGPGSGG